MSFVDLGKNTCSLWTQSVALNKFYVLSQVFCEEHLVVIWRTLRSRVLSQTIVQMAIAFFYLGIGRQKSTCSVRQLGTLNYRTIML